jgi:hypothetical protein
VKVPAAERGALGVPAKVIEFQAHDGRVYMHIRNDGIQGGRLPESVAATLKVGRTKAFEPVRGRKDGTGARLSVSSYPYKGARQFLVSEGVDTGALEKLVMKNLVGAK